MPPTDMMIDQLFLVIGMGMTVVIASFDHYVQKLLMN